MPNDPQELLRVFIMRARTDEAAEDPIDLYRRLRDYNNLDEESARAESLEAGRQQDAFHAGTAKIGESIAPALEASGLNTTELFKYTDADSRHRKMLWPGLRASLKRHALLLPKDRPPNDDGKVTAPIKNSPKRACPADLRAAASCEWASKQRPDLLVGKAKYPKELWEYIKDNDCPAYQGTDDDGQDLAAPNDHKSWARMVRRGQNAHYHNPRLSAKEIESKSISRLSQH